MDPAPCAFSVLRGRSVLVSVLVCMAAASTAGTWLWPEWAREPGGHRLQEACVQLLWYGLLGAACYGLSRRARVAQRLLWGRRPPLSALLAVGLWALPLVALSTATAYAIFLPLSYLAPELVTRWVLENPLGSLLSGGIRLDAANALLFAAVVVVGPMVEEYAFRGLLLSRWATKWGTATGIAASSAAFALWHVDPLGGAVFGYAASIAYLRSGSLLAPIGLHVANNALAWAMAVLAAGNSPAPTLEGLRGQAVYGWMALAIGAPWGVWLFRRYGWMRGRPIPYLVSLRSTARDHGTG